MGRLAASIGFAFGTGISAGISEKRKQDAEDKRSRELRDAAVSRIAKQQENAIALQQNADAIKDANILQQRIDETTANIPRMEAMFSGSTKGILPGGLPNSTFKSIITFKAGEISREQKELDRKQTLELFKIGEAGKEKRLGVTVGAKKEAAETKATRQGILDRFKAAKETIKATQSSITGQVIPGQEETNRLAIEDMEKARQDLQNIGEPIPQETELNKFERAAKIMIEGGIARGQTYDTLRSEFGDEVIATSLGEREAFVGGEIIEQVIEEPKFVGIGKSLIKARGPLEPSPVRGPFGGFGPDFSQLAPIFAEKEESAFARRVRLNVERRKKGLRDEPLQERLSGFGQSLLPALQTVPAESTVDITPLGRIKKKTKKNK